MLTNDIVRRTISDVSVCAIAACNDALCLRPITRLQLKTYQRSSMNNKESDLLQSNYVVANMIPTINDECRCVLVELLGRIQEHVQNLSSTCELRRRNSRKYLQQSFNLGSFEAFVEGDFCRSIYSLIFEASNFINKLAASISLCARAFETLLQLLYIIGTVCTGFIYIHGLYNLACICHRR